MTVFIGILFGETSKSSFWQHFIKHLKRNLIKFEIIFLLFLINYQGFYWNIIRDTLIQNTPYNNKNRSPCLPFGERGGRFSNRERGLYTYPSWDSTIDSNPPKMQQSKNPTRISDKTLCYLLSGVYKWLAPLTSASTRTFQVVPTIASTARGWCNGSIASITSVSTWLGNPRTNYRQT